jgi:hypothetical protein
MNVCIVYEEKNKPKEWHMPAKLKTANDSNQCCELSNQESVDNLFRTSVCCEIINVSATVHFFNL